MAAKIPSHIPKFKGDNNQSFKDWIAQFEAHCTALDVGAGKKVATLLCCLDSTAFSAVTEMIAADGAITYVNIKASLTTRFCGDDYKRSLQNKLQSLKFIKGTNINTFVNDLSTTIKYLYNVNYAEIIRTIALNHITSNLDDTLRSEATIFQLTGNKSIENLLEVLSTKMSISSLRSIDHQVASTSFVSKNINDTRLGKLEAMMEKVLTRLDKPAHLVCNFCNKAGHSEERRFKKKACHKCSEIGHIAKFCPKNRNEHPTAAAQVDKSNVSNDLIEPAQTILSVNVGQNKIDFLYDTGSQFSIMMKSTYDNLVTKPPLIDVTKSGIGIDGHRFDFEGIA